MAQILVPISDTAVGSWTVTPLFSKIDDDSTVNPTGDGTVITSDAVGNNASTTNADFKLAAGTDPQVSQNHILRVRWNHDTPGRSLQAFCELWQGVPDGPTSSLINTMSSPTDVGPTEVEQEDILTGFQTDAITDYSDLYVRLRGLGTGGGPSRSMVVELVELEVPDATGAQTIPVSEMAETEAAQTVGVQSVITREVAESAESEAAQAIAAVQSDSVAVGAVTETESAQIIGIHLEVVWAEEFEVSTAWIDIEAVVEAEAAEVVTPKQGLTATVNAAVESEAAQGITAATTTTVAITGATESDLAQAITPASITTIVVGTATESDLAQIISLALGIPVITESEEARPVSSAQAGSPQSRLVDPATEAEASQVVTFTTTVTVAIAAVTESEISQAISAQAVTTITVVFATETDGAETLSIALGVPGLVESEEARVVAVDAGAAPQTIPVSLVTETEVGQIIAIQTAVTVTVPTVSESDLSQPVGLGLSLSLAPEVEDSRLVAPVQAGAPQSRPVEPAAESEIARVVDGFVSQAVEVGQVTETEAAQAVSLQTATSVGVDAALEGEQAIAIGVLAGAVSIAVNFASESDQANPITVAAVFLAAITPTQESETASAIFLTQGAANITITAAIETESSHPISPDTGIVGEIGGIRDPDPTSRDTVGQRNPVLLGRSISPL